MKKLLSVIAIFALVFFPASTSFAADFVLSDNATWASAGAPYDNSDITHAAAGGNVDLHGYYLVIKNDGTASDHARADQFYKFTIGDITDSGDGNSVNVWTPDVPVGDLDVTIHSVFVYNSGGSSGWHNVGFLQNGSGCSSSVSVIDSFRILGQYADLSVSNGNSDSDENYSLTVGGNFSVEANAIVSGNTGSSSGSNSELVLGGSTNTAEGGFILDDNGGEANLEFNRADGAGLQTVTGTINGEWDGEGKLFINSGNSGITFNSQIGAIHDLREIEVATTGVATFTNAVNTDALNVTGGGEAKFDVSSNVGAVTLSSGTLSGAGILTGTSYTFTNSGTVSATLAGSGATLAKSGAGTLTLSGVNTYSGGTTLTAGTLNINNARALGTGTISIADGTTIDCTAGGDGITLTSTGAQTWNGNFTFTGTDDLNLGTGTVALGAATRTVTTTTADKTLTVGGVISSTGAFGLTKAGDGILTLTGINTYTGHTQVFAGTLNITSGGQINGAAGLIGSGVEGSTGAASVDGAGSRWESSVFTVGHTRNGTLEITRGGVVSGTQGVIANSAASTSTATVDGADSDAGTTQWNNSGNFTVAQSGNGTLSIRAGGVVNNAEGYIAGGIGSTGTATVDGVGSIWTNSSTLYVGDNGHGTLNITGGGVVKAGGGTGAVILADGAVDSAGTINIGGDGAATTAGTLSAATVTGGSGPAVVNFTQTDAHDFDPILAGTLSVNQTGSGITTLTKASTYTGATNVNAGTLNVTGSILASSLTTVQTAGTLMGTGTTGALMIASGGTLAPGASPGTLESVGAVTYAAGGTYTWEINDAEGMEGTNWDLHDITGGLTITSGVGTEFTIAITSLTLGNLAGEAANFNKYDNYTWVIASTTTGITEFDALDFDLDDTAFQNDVSGDTNGYFGISVSGNDLQLTYTAAVNTPPNPIYWKGDTSGAWNLHAGDGTTNWATTLGGGTDADALPDATANVHFYATGAGNFATTLGENFSVKGLTMESTAVTAVTIGDGVELFGLTIGADGILLESGSDDLTINSDITLGGAQAWTNENASGGSKLIVNGDVENGANLLTVSGTGDSTISGSIINGAGGLTKTGNGSLVLSGTNTYTGLTNVQGGILTLSNGAAIKDTSVVTVSGGTLNVDDAETVGAVTLSSGTISGDSVLTGAADFDVRAGAISAALDGAAGLTKTTAGTVTLSGVNTYTGATTVVAGTLNLSESLTTSLLGFSGAGTVNLAVGKNIVGAVTTSSDGNGTLNFLGDSIIGGNIGVAGAGDLAVVSMAGLTASAYDISATNINIGANGTLKLTGDIATTGTLATAGAAASALDLQGYTLTHTGNMTFGADSDLNLDLTTATLSFGKATVSGTLDLEATVDITVNVIGSTYIAGGTQFLVIDGNAGSDVDGGNTVTDNSYLLSFTATTDALSQDLILVAVRSQTLNALPGENSNTAAVGNALEGARAGATGDMLNVLTILDNMSSAAQIIASLETMTPDVSSGTLQGSRSLNSHFLTAIQNRLTYARNGFSTEPSGLSAGDGIQGMGFWMQGLGNHASQGTREGIQGYSANTFGTSIGFDKLLSNHFRMGFAGGYGFGSINSKTPGSPHTNINSFQATIYGSFDSVNLCKARKERKYSPESVRDEADERLWYVDGMISFTQNNYDSKRKIFVGTEERTAKADHYGQQYSTQFEAGYTFLFDQTRDLEVTPFVSLGYNYLYMNQYKERGADALDLNVRGKGFNQFTQGLGMKFAYPILSEEGTYIPSVKGAWLFDYITDKFQTTASFAGGGPSFNTIGVTPSRNAFLVGAELAFLNKGNMTLTGNFDWMIRDRYQSYTYYLTARFDF